MTNQKQKTILLVEDDTVAMMVEVDLLKSFGYDVVTAKSGEEAVQIATGNDKIALILMDINLGPGMDGAEAAMQILGKRDLPIVFLTEHPEKEYVERVKEITRYGYVMKSSDKFVLQSSLEMAFELFEVVEMLRASEEIFNHFMKNSPIYVYFKDENIKAIRLSENFTKMLGKPISELLGKNMDDLFPSDLSKSMVADDKRVLKKGKKIEIEEELNGRVYSTIKFPIHREGKPACLAGFTIDITERKRTEKALLFKTMLLEAQSETSIDGILAVDNEGHAILFNKRFGEIWKIPRQILDTKDDKKMLEYVAKQLKDPAEFSRKVTYLYEHKDEKDRDEIEFADGRCFDRYSSPLISADGKNHGRIWYFRDITERKRMEMLLHERIKELNCLHGISTLMGRYNSSLDEILRGAVELIPPALQYPDITGARIVLKDRKFQTANFQKTAWVLAHDIVVHGKSVGCVEVCYLKPAPTDGPTFLKEEERLLNIIAERLGSFVERKKVEEALRASEVRYNALFTSAAEGILVADLKMEQFRYTNPTACRMFGYTEAELLRLRVADIHPKESLDHVIAEFEAMARGEKTMAPDIPCLRKDGTLFYVNISGVVMVLDDHHCNVGFFTDITKHKKAQEVLRQSEEKYRNLTENLSELVYRADPKTNAAIYVNKAVEGIYGYMVEEWLKDPMLWINTIHPDDKERVFAEVVKAQKKLESVIVAYRIIRKDKTVRWVENHVTWEKDRQGNAVSMNGLMYDITERKLMQEKILVSEKLAVMGRLTADMAHELNNPLAIVIGGSQLMLNRLGKKPQEIKFKSQLETVLRNARRCKSVVNNLLGYGRTIGKKEEVVNLPDLIREAIEDVNYQHDMSGIETVLNCAGFATQPSPEAPPRREGPAFSEASPKASSTNSPSRSPGRSASAERGASNAPANAKITGNRSALLSVFINLIRNSRQAMGEKGRLTITIEKEDAKHLRIEIHDTGIGISKKQKVKLFKPFTSGWKKGESSGLGLATSLGIIETHGGSMSAESEGIGKGATFTILLPCEFKSVKRIS